MLLNLNIGLLGHIDSGKTSLAKVLSTISSTAAFDCSPQCKERGITLDLGFSAALLDTPQHLKLINPAIDKIQLTFVDCPGHASLIKTIIGGAQIIDLMLLVIDAQKGIQTQTAECIAIGEVLNHKLIVVVNKIDLLDVERKERYLIKLEKRLRNLLAITQFSTNFPIYNVSTRSGIGIVELLDGIQTEVHLPQRNIDGPLLMYVDHCFSIKGQGTICTGTIVQGNMKVGDCVELPTLNEQRKIKSIQMFRKTVKTAAMGDRVGVCFTQFNANKMERGVLCIPGCLQKIQAVIIRMRRIRYYKYPLKSKCKLHVTIGYDTALSKVIFFRNDKVNEKIAEFDHRNEYEYIEEIEAHSNDFSDEIIFALLEFERPILTMINSTLIASKLDLGFTTNCCRLAFWGVIQWHATSTTSYKDALRLLKVYKTKLKLGTVQRLVNAQEIIVQNFFKKTTNRQIYIGKYVQLSTGEIGIIDSTFGQTSKVKIKIKDSLHEDTIKILSGPNASSITVSLKFIKSVFNKNVNLIQQL